MKTFLTRFVVFFIPLVFTAVFAEFFIRNIPNDYKYKSEYLTKNATKIEILFLGNSHAYYGINPKFISQKSFNAAHVSQSLAYDLEIFKKFEKQLINVKVIAIPISYFSLHFNIEGGKEAWREKNYCIYYNILKSKKPINYFEITSNTVKTNCKIISDKLQKNKNLIKTDTLGWQIHDSIFYKDIEKNAKRSAKRHTYYIKKNLVQNNQILNNFITIAKQKNIKILFYTAPVTKAYFKLLKPKKLNQLNEIMTNLANNKTIFYKNWLSEPHFENENFYDADHLNDKGTIKFSKLINQTLNEIQ